MNKESTKVVDIVETYLREAAEEKSTLEQIEFNINKLPMENELESDEFAIEVVLLKDSYMLPPFILSY